MKKIRVLCLTLCLTMFLSVMPVSATDTSDPAEGTVQTTQPNIPYEEGSGDSSVSSGSRSINAQVPLWGSDRLLETAGAAMLYELNSESMVYAWNPDLQIYPASLVKIMTCLLALENCDLSEQVTVTTTAIATLPKDTTLNFVIGETWPMEDMLYCLMVEGYNDAAVVIAEHVAGSQQAFVNLMNNRAREIGCTGTHFTNATGFHDDEQLSTTRDLVKILREALRHEDFMTFFSETVHRLPATDLAEARYMETTNYMMTQTITAEYYDARVTGGRTGVTEARERCLIVTAESKGLHYIAIVMCAKATINEDGDIVRFGSYEEVKELLKKGFEGHKVTQVLSDTQILTQYPVTDGQNSVTVGPSTTLYTVLPTDILSTDLSYRYQQTQSSLTAPVKAGEQITTVQVWYGNVCVAQAPVVTRNSSAVSVIDDQSVLIEENREGLMIALRVVGILAGVVLSVACVIYLVQLTRRASQRAQYRRRRRSRRRSK